MITPRKTIDTHWEVRTYDVWGNAQDGYWVNDSFVTNRDYVIRVKPVTYNLDTPNEFIAAFPTDYQLQKLFGVRCELDITGDDINIYVNRASDWYLIGELHCTSHASLSPVRQYAAITENVNLPD